jgi:hypothetical protein
MSIILLNPILILAFILMYLIFDLELCPDEGDLQLVKHFIHGLELELHQLLVHAKLFEDLGA